MRAIAILGLLAFLGPLVAEDKKAEVAKPVGSWTKKAEGFDLKFNFNKEVMVFSMSNGGDGCEMTSKCTFEKDGIVKCEVTKFEKKGNFPGEIDVGFKFSFQFETNDKKAKVSKIEGSGIGEQEKAIVEGDYEKAAN